MKNDKTLQAASELMQSVCQQFQSNEELLKFASAMAALSLGVIESLSNEEHLKGFVAGAIGPERLRIQIERGMVQ